MGVQAGERVRAPQFTEPITLHQGRSTQAEHYRQWHFVRPLPKSPQMTRLLPKPSEFLAVGCTVFDVSICSQQLVGIICFCLWERAHGIRISFCTGTSVPWDSGDPWVDAGTGLPAGIPQAQSQPCSWGGRAISASHWSCFVSAEDSTFCRHFSPVVWCLRWSPIFIYRWVVGPWFELNLHSLRRHFLQAMSQFWRFVPTSFLFSQHPFKNCTAELYSRAYCVIAIDYCRHKIHLLLLSVIALHCMASH